MSKRIAVLVFTLLVAANAWSMRWSWDGGTTFVPGFGDIAASLLTACQNRFGPASTFIGFGGLTPFGPSSTVSSSTVVGQYFDIVCAIPAGNSIMTLTIYSELPTCVAGTPSPMIYQTTIESINELNEAVPAGSMPTPQCSPAGCVVTRSAGQGAAGSCTGYLNAAVARTVGAPLWVSCAGDGQHFSGQTCNMPGADQQGVTATATLPPSAVIDSGNGGGNGGGGLSQDDSDNIAGIAEATTELTSQMEDQRIVLNSIKSSINSLRNDVKAADTNAEGRSQDLLASLGDIKGVLDGIKTNTAGGGTGGGGSGIPADGFSATGGLGDMPGVPTADAPTGGLKSTGEDGVKAFTDAMNATSLRATGSCPTWTLESDYFSRTYVFDQHCQLFDDNRATLEGIMIIVWSVSALVIVLKA